MFCGTEEHGMTTWKAEADVSEFLFGQEE